MNKTGNPVVLVLMWAGRNRTYLVVSIVCAMLSGLMVNAGVGLLVLFRVSRNRKENWTVVGLILMSGILLGSVFGLLFGEIL